MNIGIWPYIVLFLLYLTENKFIVRTNVGGCARGLCAKGVRWGCALGFVRACAPQRGTVVRGDCAQGCALRLCAHCALSGLKVLCASNGTTLLGCSG